MNKPAKGNSGILWILLGAGSVALLVLAVWAWGFRFIPEFKAHSMEKALELGLYAFVQTALLGFAVFSGLMFFRK